MGIIKGVLKVGASAILVATGTASTILKGISDTVGLEMGSELFGAAKNASFNGIRTMWNVEAPQEEEYAAEETTEKTAIENEIRKLKVQALRCKDMAQKAETEEVRLKFMERYECLMAEANELSKEIKY